MSVSLIWAQARDRVIGANGAIPWHLPEDLASFKVLTMGATVVMGRTTWESLPPRFRPLPGRRNVVLTRQRDWHADGAEVAHSIGEALSGDERIWVIGGATVYAEALPYADRIVVTDIDEAYDGDTFAPELDDSWEVVGRDPEDGWHTSTAGLRYRITRYKKPS